MTEKFKPIFPTIAITLFFIGSLTATIIAWLAIIQIMDSQIKEDYFRDNQNVTNWIQTRVNTYLDLLTATQGFAANSDMVTRIEWTNFTKNIQIAERYQGLRAIIYLPRVKAAEKNAFVARIRKENNDLAVYTNFSVWPEQQQAEYFPVTYTHGTNQADRYKVLGQDASTDKIRVAVLDYSRDNNQPTFSPPLSLKTDPQTGFIIVLPVYFPGAQVDTIKQRRDSLAGFVYAPFQADEFFNAILRPQGTDAFPNLDLEVYDPEAEDSFVLLYDKNTDLGLTKDTSQFAYTSEYLLNLGNRHWQIKTGIPYKNFTDPKRSPIPLAVFITGLLLSITTFTILMRQYCKILKITQSN